MMRTFTTMMLIAAMGFAMTDDIRADESMVVEDDIVYGQGGEETLRLDLARPKGDGPFPGVLILHGGGWGLGTRKDFRAWMQQAARRGFVAVSADYRLAVADADGRVANIFPAQLHDVKCAVRWMRANAGKYHIDPKRIAAVGSSAGAQLALRLGLSSNATELEGDGGHPTFTSAVSAVAHWAGPTQMAKFHQGTSNEVRPFAERYLGGTPAQQPQRYKAASALTYVTADAPPILSIHGTVDEAVPFEQSQLLDQAMKRVGAEHTLLALDGQGHSYDEASNARGMAAMFKFLDKHLK